MWFRGYRLVGISVSLAMLVACTGDTGSGPKEVKWDRDACERCRMVVSDRYHAAQIRYFPPDKKRSEVAMFDDIGCATLWLAKQPWEDDPNTEIWVADHRTGDWIDATKATYVTGNLTPMEFGLGAQLETAPGGLNFEQAKQHIIKVEKRFDHHGVHLMERLKQQARHRQGTTEQATTGAVD
ncbi:MAG: nitrous oxide reductase accessory protein NosL [Candidatus Thiodiazotropha sp. (ex. Lucinisca nassula)]|nr:nitrous oxide reductase accessory protein NosL [Candidatus Thiodiazotropha sp. (ex. Lucinisca nassula)]MBW9270730.1 nitrous oxide reductase accessory protein NosL [Candidatus Thiodiazotropha sp. (ex. Lucinisca nassula)]